MKSLFKHKIKIDQLRNSNIVLQSKRAGLGSMLVLSLLLFGNVKAQDSSSTSGSLSLEQAIQIALNSNNSVQIAKNNTEMAENQNNIGNAGYLPTVTGNANVNYGINNTTIQFLTTPTPTEFKGAQNTNYGTNVSLNYTIFGGLGAVNTYKQLKLNEENASVQERLNIETIILQTIQAYCQVLQAQNNHEIAFKAVEISKERIKRARTRFELAGATKLELLNAQVDFNADSVNVINTKNALETARYRLAQLLNTDPEQANWTVQDIELNNSNLSKQQLTDAALSNNAQLLNAHYNSEISEVSTKITRSGLMPRLSVQGTYNIYSRSESDASIVAFSESNGFSGVLQLSIPIFDGQKKSIQYQNAQIQAKNAELSRAEAENTLRRDLNVGVSNYQRAVAVAKMDQTIIEAAKLNFDRTREMFQNGQVNGLQFREAQLNLLRAESQAVNNEINVKLAEVELMRLSGQLIQ